MSTAETAWPRLVADIGGTNARFALETEPMTLSDVCVLACNDFPTITDAIRHFLHQVGDVEISHAAIAIANPIVGDWVQMTNHHWAFSIETTRQALRLETLILLNDFTAQALCVPHLPKSELVKIGGRSPIEKMPIAVMGPGTGLGVSGLIPCGNGYIPLAGEGSNDMVVCEKQAWTRVSRALLIGCWFILDL